MEPPSQLSLQSNLSTDPETEGFDFSAGKTWVYPKNYPIREYQYSIVSTALFNNTLVCLPTGLGKTFIAAVVMYNFRRWYPQGKIVFLAPTKALVGQQINACHDVMGIPSSETIELTGTTHQKNRHSAWIKHSIIFATPQVFHKDLEKDIVPVKKIKCIVVDEAHKALGKHSYCESIRILSSKNKYFRVVGLSATPGSKLDNVLEVIRNLHISNLELRDETSEDIIPYTNNRKIDILMVPLSNELAKFNDKYVTIMDRHVKVLINCKVITGNTGNLSKGRIFYLTKEFKEKSNRSGNYGQIMKTLNILNTMYHAYDLMVRHGLRAFCHFYRNHSDKFWMSSEVSLLALLDEIEGYLGPFPNIRPLPNGEIPEVPRNIVFGHNKFYKLQELLLRHFKCSGEGNPDTRAIVFVEYRDIVNEVYVLLLQSRPLIRPQMFVGQAGQKQKEQTKALEDFRENRVNVLISTSVGEEGLDVGEVDLIICFDISQQSPIRLVQRMGRTGRKRDGHIIVLVTDGKEHQTLKNAIAKRDSLLTKVMYSSNILSNLYDENPRMVPAEFQPECYKLIMKVQPKSPKIADKKKKKKENVEIRSKKNIATKNKSNSSNTKQKGGGQSMMDKYLQHGHEIITTQTNTNALNYIKAEDVLLLTNDEMASEFLTLCAMKKSAQNQNRNKLEKSDWFQKALCFPKTTVPKYFKGIPKPPNIEFLSSLNSWIRSLPDIPDPPDDFVEDKNEVLEDDYVFSDDQRFEYDVTVAQEIICSPEIEIVYQNQSKNDKERNNLCESKNDKERNNPSESIFEHLLASSSESEEESQVMNYNCNTSDRSPQNRIECEDSKEASYSQIDLGKSLCIEELFDASSSDFEEDFRSKAEPNVDKPKKENPIGCDEKEKQNMEEIAEISKIAKIENFPDRDEIQSTPPVKVMEKKDFSCDKGFLPSKGSKFEGSNPSSPGRLSKQQNIQERIPSPFKNLQKAPENHYTSGSEVDMFADDDDDDDCLKDFNFEFDERNSPAHLETPRTISEKILTQENPALEEANPETDKEEAAVDLDSNLQMSPIISGFTRYYKSQSTIDKKSSISHESGNKNNRNDKNPGTENEQVPGPLKSRQKNARKALEPDFFDKNAERESTESGICLPEEKNQSFLERENSGKVDPNEVILLDSDNDIFTSADSFFDDLVEFQGEKPEVLENQREGGGKKDTSKGYLEQTTTKENVNKKSEAPATCFEDILISDDDWEEIFEVSNCSLQGKSEFFENESPPGSSKKASSGSPEVFAGRSSESMSLKLSKLKSKATKGTKDKNLKIIESEKNIFLEDHISDDDFDVFAMPNVVLDKENSFGNVQSGKIFKEFKRPEVKKIHRSNVLGNGNKNLAREPLEERKKEKKKKTSRRRAAALEFLDNEAEVSTDECITDGSSGEDSNDDLDGFVSHTQEVHDVVDIRAHYLQAVRSPIRRPGAFLLKDMQSRKCNDSFDVYSQVLSQDNDTYLCDSFCVDGDAADETQLSQYSILEEMERKLKEKKRKRRNNLTSPKEKQKRRIHLKNDSSSSEDETEKLRQVIQEESFRLKRMKK